MKIRLGYSSVKDFNPSIGYKTFIDGEGYDYYFIDNEAKCIVWGRAANDYSDIDFKKVTYAYFHKRMNQYIKNGYKLMACCY